MQLGGKTNLEDAIAYFEQALEPAQRISAEKGVSTRRLYWTAKALLTDLDASDAIKTLQKAEKDYRDILTSGDEIFGACTKPEQARVYHGFGRILLRLAKHADPPQQADYFGQAAQAFKGALTIREDGGPRADRANTEDDLGQVLLELGKRESGQSRDDHLCQAKGKLRSALSYYTQQAFPNRYNTIANALNQIPGLLPDARSCP